MKKYGVLVRGENFLVSVNEQAEKLGFYTTVYLEALDDQSAELKTMELLRTDEKLVSVTLNSKSDSPMTSGCCPRSASSISVCAVIEPLK